MAKHECPQCGQEMQLSSKVIHKGERSTYRIRRFYCALCDFSEMIIADGENDLKHEPRRAIESIENVYKQEEQNRS